jgi:heme/copper-type cytochrome/quinol oxidase subunit 3
VGNRTLAFPRPAEPREPLIPSSVLGMLLFVGSEVMLFAGLISAHGIARAGARGGVWPPPGQPRLPIELTAFNTVLLLLSGVALFVAGRAFMRGAARSRRWLTAAAVLGGCFVGIQGFEWARLIREGLTLTSSTHGSFFYVIVGLHALHAVVAIGSVAWALQRLAAKKLELAQLQAVQVFWYFVVGIWPLLYWQVYL